MSLRLDRDRLSPAFSVIAKRLQKAGIFLSDEGEDVKNSTLTFSERAIQAVNKALQAAVKLGELREPNGNLMEAARLLEKIQILATEAERSAFIDHSHEAQVAYRTALSIASLSRQYFHEMKR